MEIAEILYKKLNCPISKLIENYLDSAALLNLGSSTALDADEIYNKFYNKREFENQFDLLTNLSINMFLEAWPIVSYLQHVKNICQNNSVFNFICQNLTQIQQTKLIESIIDLSQNINLQLFLVNICNNQYQNDEYTIQQWNKLQNKLFMNSVDILELCSEVHLNGKNDKVRSVLMSPINAMKWFGFLFGKSSIIMANSAENKQAAKARMDFFKYLKYGAIFTTFASAVLMVFGNRSYRDVYIVIMLAAIAAGFYARFYAKNIENMPQKAIETSRQWVSESKTDEIYCSRLSSDVCLF